MLPPDDSFLLDRVVVYEPPDDHGSALDGDPGDPIACAVQAASPDSQAGRGKPSGGVPMRSELERRLVFAADPGIDRADLLLAWTEHDGEALSPAPRLRTTGAAIRPGGIAGRWTVIAMLAD